jgi:aldehyde:ferredoxin oxidoreductase
MPNGYWGRLLRVDLTSGKISVEEQDEKFYRRYFGGWGIVAHYLLKEVPAGCDPLGPDNVLVFAASVLTGTAIPGAGRNSAGAKSPLTGAFGASEAGGDWGVKLRWAGYDALIISGQSEKPVYLWINNETVELRDASQLWGLEAYPAQQAIRHEVGDARASTALIGPGGERLVRFACIALDLHDFLGRTGLGAVMGAKKLKAIAVNGKTRPEVADKAAVMDTARWMRDNYEAPLGTMQDMGTARGVPSLNAAGGLPTRNFREGSFEGYETLTGRHMTDTILVDRESCYACPVHCKRVVATDEEGLSVSTHYGGPEYETIGGFGSGCGIGDIKIVAKANEMCNRHTLDTISASLMVSGAMECAEQGLLPPHLIRDLDDLRFGSSQALLGLLEQMVNRDGLGDILAEGPAGVAEKLGQEVASYFLHVKGQPLPLHEPRWKAGMGLGYALSPTGADHMHNIHDPFYANEEAPSFAAVRNMGILDAVDSFELSPAKARMYVYMMLNKSVNNNLSLCSFMPYNLDMLVEQVRAVTGWNVSNWELLKATERTIDMARAFNAREGFSAADDVLPDRFFEPLQGGPLQGKQLDRSQFFETRALTYDMLGWDRQTAAPKRWKLYELGLDWVVEDLEKRGLFESERLGYGFKGDG